MASTRRKCLNFSDSFCYICGSFTVPSQRMNISEFVKRAHLAYFKLKMGDQDKSWAPHNVRKPCAKNLCRCTKGQVNNYHLAFLWCGGCRRTMQMIATFASQKFLGIARKLNRNWVTQILVQQFVSHHTHMKYQYLFSQNCLHWKMKMIYVNQMKIMGMPVIQTLCEYINQRTWKLQPGRTQLFN